MIRLLYLTHRWVGVALALFMLLWFASGLIIAYSGSVITTPEQRLAHAQTLHPDPSWLSLGEAIGLNADARQAGRHNGEKTRAGGDSGDPNPDMSNDDEIVDGRLARVDSEPVWRIEEASGERFAISAIDGAVQSYSVESAKRIAERWFAAEATPGKAPPTVSYIDTFDAATSLRNYQRYKPFHRFAAEDGLGTEVIVSAKTGEVLQVATVWERDLYYAGNFVHLFRPLDLLHAGDLRRNTLLWAGLFAFTAGLSGMIIGWLRWKPGFFGKPTYSKGRTQPYREFYLRYHFWAGLIGGTFAVLWAFSGALSTNPLQIFSEATASSEELGRFRGGAWPLVITSRTPEISPDIRDVVVELGWSHLGDQAQLLAFKRNGSRDVQNTNSAAMGLDKKTLLAAAQRLAGDESIAGEALLTDYDSYYYPNRRQGSLEKPLPILRVDFADAGRTSIYINPEDGRLITKMDTSRRAYRWLYTALHHWDFGWLHHRPLWFAWMTTWIAFGLALSISSVVLGWRRLRRTIRVHVPAPQMGEEASPVRGLTLKGAVLGLPSVLRLSRREARIMDLRTRQ